MNFGHSLEVQQDANDWQKCATVVDSLAYTIKNLEVNSMYRFRVRAENIHGRSEPSLCSDFVTITESHASTEGVRMHSEYDATDNNIDGHEFAIQQGDDFKSRFRLEEKLGKGRFGVVHRVVEYTTGQIWAAKMVKCIKAKDKVKVSCSVDI